MQNNYLYFGLGIIAVLALSIASLISVQNSEKIQPGQAIFQMTVDGANYTAISSKQELFSPQGTTLNFSSFEQSPKNNSECVISCKKNE